MPYPSPELKGGFPDLNWYEETSPTTPAYNCHAWGADRDDVWWEPGWDPNDVAWPWRKIEWPLPDDASTLQEFQRAHGTLGFIVCQDGNLEPGMEKIVHYVRGLEVSHTARQLPWGHWTSKLGEDVDIEHQTPDELEGPVYGRVGGYMKRPIQSQHVHPRALFG